MSRNNPPCSPLANRYLTEKDVADCMQVDVRTVQRWISRGWLKRVKIGGITRITQKDFDDFLEKQRS